MAKSPINILLDEDNKQHKEKRKRTDVIKYSMQGAEREISLRCLDHQICDVTQPEVTDGVRLTNIDKLKDKIHEYFELGRSSFARQIFYNCKSYIANADAHDLEPFSKEGWKSFFGVNGYIWGLVNDAKIQHTHSFMYENNQSVGISEKTAAGMKRIIKNIFSSLKLDVFGWNKGLKEFSTAGKRKVPPDPFTQREHEEALNHIHEKFFLMAVTLLAEHKLNPNFIASEVSLYSEICDNSQNKNNKFERELRFLKGMNAVDTFNMTMGLAYYLLCHYSAFNDSVITSIRRPITIVTEKIEGKISTYGTIKGYKGRAIKHVTATLAEEISEDDLTELQASEYEEIHARVDKRTGITFLKMLLQLSDSFNPEKYGLLLFEIDNNRSIKELRTDNGGESISRELELFADKRIGLADRFSENLITLLDSDYMEKVKVKPDDKGVKRVIKERVHIETDSPSFVTSVQKLSLSFFQCFTNQSLWYAQLPLYFSKPDERGKITVTCTVAGDASNFITLYVDERYIPALKRSAMWATSMHQKKSWIESRALITQNDNADTILGSTLKSSKNIPYLFPASVEGVVSRTKLYPVTDTFLQDLGVRVDHFYSTLNASRFRLTVADNEYRKSSMTSAIAVLQNSKGVFEQHYANGHSGLNNEIIAQAIDVIEEIIKGVELEQAKDMVRENWKIEVLTFDEYKKKNKPSNPNGVSCDGKPDFKGNEQRLAQNQAEKLGVTDSKSKVHCYQYDKCDECQSAKLVEDPYQVYKFLSFIESLIDAADLHPENAEELESRIQSFENLLSENISDEIITKAEEILDEKGRYFMFV